MSSRPIIPHFEILMRNSTKNNIFSGYGYLDILKDQIPFRVNEYNYVKIYGARVSNLDELVFVIIQLGYDIGSLQTITFKTYLTIIQVQGSLIQLKCLILLILHIDLGTKHQCHQRLINK